ncbi:twin-arginine translocase subunit TatC [Sulfurovum sp. bin170]|uniref:twin-arginine translocase subunit TatC n=1 Tax=Sulfurovum sp. bin170 TaxID=2695268 RepID=UPI0013DFBFC0|nr:twin-arginine translocase subunit TatC [Sulfurovum sp. bin170]NEW60631.1 twin-arginine translocase subunit TatC [Sulfurovum sp. bin170]
MFKNLRPHLIELRKRLGISVGVIIVFAFVAFGFNQYIIAFAKAPLVDILIANEQKDPFIGGIGIFFTALKISIFTGFIFALPVVFAQLWAFIAPGLYDNEKKYVIPFVSISTLMFLIGAAFAYYVVIPLGFEFLWIFAGKLVNFLQTLDEYISIFTKILFGFGVAFELPVILFFLGVLGLVDDKNLKDFFGYAVLLIFVFAAILTPPDVITQLLMAGPLILLYGLSIIIVRMVNPYKAEDEDDDDNDDNKDTVKADEPKQLN